MRLLRSSLILVVALSPVVVLFAGCNSEQEAVAPLAKVSSPMPKTSQELEKAKGKAKGGGGHSPDVLPGPPK